jgi:2-amino-4-hydroxy-6-hydroxymethyldihydropteridine diphosphokinase
MKTAHVGIGSNLGDKRDNCFKAMDRMGQIPGCKVTGRSDLYLTKPWGVEGQDWYANAVASISTKISAQDLLENLQAIEADMGRVREEKWEARIIDLDILLFGDDVINEENLTIPHPLMHLRRFVLVPLVQLAPELIHPSLGMTMDELLQKLPEDDQEVIPFEEK